jgi:nicotinamidase/pyrazinamidase
MTLLLIIDMQNDFCRPNGSLYVKGAEKDASRLGIFIMRYRDRLDHIIMTQDNHHVIDISHPVFWEDSNGNQPAAFTEINTDDIEKGTWKPRFEKEKAVEYITKLENQREFPHVVWPEHCIIGSYGAAIVDEIMEPVRIWAREGRCFDVVIKGTNPLTEHFGVLMANVPREDSPETQLNKELIRKLRLFDTVLIAGEAKSHCVANTIRQILNIEGLAKKLVILEDCMSDVTGFETLAQPIYEKAKRKDVRFTLSTKWFS